MNPLDVYNLEFPAYVNELNIGGYSFRRVENYEAALLGLQHRAEILLEFNVRSNTGTHQLTATVQIPDNQQPGILPWAAEGNFTKLQDVLLLLTLFTGRNVFALNEGENGLVLRPDPREHFYGQDFILSLKTKDRYRHRESGRIFTEKQMQGVPIFDYDHFDGGLEETLNEVLETITSEEWQAEYGNGYCLFLFRQAMLQYGIETAFMLCWTIWEHLFTLNKQASLSEKQISDTGGEIKVTFVLKKYFEANINNTARAAIKRLTRARNRLVHFGVMPDDVLIAEMRMFVRLTERIMAMALGLEPADPLNTLGALNSFLSGER